MIDLKILPNESSDFALCRMMFGLTILDCSRRIKSKMKTCIIEKSRFPKKVGIPKTVWVAATGRFQRPGATRLDDSRLGIDPDTSFQPKTTLIIPKNTKNVTKYASYSLQADRCGAGDSRAAETGKTRSDTAF